MDVTVSSDDDPEKIKVANQLGGPIRVAGRELEPGETATVAENGENVQEAIMLGSLSYAGHEE